MMNLTNLANTVQMADRRRGKVYAFPLPCFAMSSTLLLPDTPTGGEHYA